MIRNLRAPPLCCSGIEFVCYLFMFADRAMNQLLPVCFPTVSFFFAAFMMVAGHSLAQKELDTGTFVPAMEEISPGVFKIGKIRLDKTKRSVTFPGKLNMAKDLIEYVLVTPDGSTHESLLTAEIQPTDLQFVMLLLDAKGAGLLAPQPDAAPPGQINAEYLKTAPRLKGDNISIAVAWKTQDGSEKIVPLEDLLMHEETKKPAPRGPWLYNGSMFGADGKFLAQQQGCFISVVTNPAALINNPRKGSDNDRIWAVNEKQSPPVGTAVEISITLLPGSSETK